MIVTDCRGRRRLEAFGRAREEFYRLAYLANCAADEVSGDVYTYEHPHFANGDADAAWWACHDRYFASNVSAALAAILRTKQALLDVLAYIDGLDLTPYPPAAAREATFAELDHLRAVFFSNALNVCDALRGGAYKADLFARTLAAADDLTRAVRRAGDQYILKE